MKTERRHELEANTLANWLGGTLESANQYTKSYSKTVAAVLVAVLLIGGSYYFLSNRSASQKEAGWDSYFNAFETGRPEDLLEVAEQYPGQAVAHWALLRVADMQLASGVQSLFTDRSLSQQELQKAAENYQTVIDQSQGELIRQHAIYGLARTKESLNDLAGAQEEYDRLAADWPQGAYAKIAKTRSADLQRQPTKMFYDWFAAQSPRPVLQGEPGFGNGQPPFDLESLPDDSPGLTDGASESGSPVLDLSGGLSDTFGEGDATNPSESSPSDGADAESPPSTQDETPDSPSEDSDTGDSPQ